jgi:squalene-hopene/tetraprenyl-beta-curcumene cyclase
MRAGNRFAVLGLAGAVAAASAWSVPARAADAVSADVLAKGAAARDRGVEFLLKSQKDNGQWGEDPFQPAVSALVLRALLGSGKATADSPEVKKGLEFLLTFRKDDGGIYKDLLKNYNTAISIMALHAAGRPQDKAVVKAGQDFLLKNQYAFEDKDELEAKKNPWFGGAGYGKDGRPDLSNTSFMLQALKETSDPNDPKVQAALKRAQVYLSRCQLRSESNDQEFAKNAGDDGGFVYGVGDTRGPKTTDASGQELLRSYGSMTYAGFKSMLYAGLSKDDPRVKDAFKWIGRNYTLAENPNMGKAGLFYYYQVFAKALAEYGEPVITDRDGVKHNWREELINRLAAMQSADGSWINTEKRWMETEPRLVTSYALMALEEALRK